MIYLKSFLAGIIVLILSALLISICLVVFFIVYQKLHPGVGIMVGLDFPLLFHENVIPWILPLAIFCLGFWWEFRRASRASKS